MEMRSWVLCTVFFVYLHFLIPVIGQGLVDPSDQNAVVNTFYLTSRSDCDAGLKQIYDNEAIIQGFDISETTPGPRSCTITISSASIYPGVQLKITIISMNIRDCTTSLSVYDGQGTQKLGAFDCRSSTEINRMHLVTSGDTVTFIMSRDNPENRQFDIEIRVNPIRGGINPDYDKNNFFSFQKFDQDAIVGMIGGLYGLVIVICLGLTFYFLTRYRGMNKKWETHQLATMKTDTAFEMRSQASQPPFSVVGQQGATSQYSRSYTDPYSRKGAGARSEDGSSVYDHDTKFSQRNLMNDERDRRRDRDRIASQNTTYDDDEEDPNNFKEKVITPRWKPRAEKSRNRRPPSFEEATRERSSEEESDDGTHTETEDESSDNDSTRKRLTTSSDYSETASESTQSDNSSNRSSATGARARRNKKSKKKPSKARRRRQNSSDDASSQRTERTEPRRKPHPPQMPGMQGAAAMPYPAYGPPPPGGHFVPVMMAPPAYGPPQYPIDPRQPVHAQAAVQPTDPPVYSYLVRRGYTPHDPKTHRNSPAGSVASNQRGGGVARPMEEPDTPLQSGVDYMAR